MCKMKHKVEVPYIDQSVRYPTGCESVSTVMLLHFLGIDLSVDDFIEKYLPREEFETRDDEWFGPDPRKVFCGSPYDEESYGCYAPVIVKALNKIFQERQQPYEALDETGKTAKELARKYVELGMPVIFWACIEMREPITGPVWKLKETGEEFVWISNEHCMLLVGEDEENYIFNDPYGNHGVISYEKELVENRHQVQHSMAVGIRHWGKESLEDGHVTVKQHL